MRVEAVDVLDKRGSGSTILMQYLSAPRMTCRKASCGVIFIEDR